MDTSHLRGRGVTLALHDYGGTGDDVLICHATGFHGRAYRAFAEQLTDTFHVVAVDLRAHGDSTSPSTPEEFSWDCMAADVAVVIDSLDGSAVHGFGHSMGGAALLGAEHTRPGTFASAFVFEPIVPPFGGFGPQEPEIQTRARIRRSTFSSHAEALERYAARPPLGLLRADVLHDYVEHGFAANADGSVTLKCAPEDEAATFGMAGSINLQMMPAISVDTVVGMSGDGEPPARLASAVANALPNGSLLEFPDIGHFGPLEGPVSVARAFRAHIESLSRPIP